MSEKVLFHQEGPLGTITLNRPASLNALDNDMIADILSYLHIAKKKEEIRVVRIKGEGKAFCAGDDLVDMGTKDHPNPSDKLTEYMDGYPAIVKAMRGLEKPIIAQVHKYALGAGLEIALAADFILASKETRFGLPFVMRGLSAGTVLLQEMVGYHQAAKYLYLGEMFTAQEAFDWKLLHELTESNELEDAALHLANRLEKSATRAIGLMKTAMHASRHMDMQEAFQVQVYSTFGSYHTEDYKEGVQAFIEKRSPKFYGK
ncbi:enoyl-CoA hydratase/isomerase family protein [Bhargavaea beijingensis]|uniref:enoyl-CoA hydratase/isomerase family protein n=1 Tax=Bhargavaea beijingensis TaxID=426756 RepID=UPI002224D938|nr:enoyl-CoA hydratase-related protein [Bhargavaea beijingensis]MCW1927379.1 enoyl-CoA hydratase-related protein [Bhargavaea beijingensis]